MSMSWENNCIKCGKYFDSFYASSVCSQCWDDSDTYKRIEYLNNIHESDKNLLLDNNWKHRAETAEKKLSKLPKWLVKML